MICIMCRRPVDLDDQEAGTFLGEAAIHYNCLQNFDARHGAEIARSAMQPSTEEDPFDAP